MRIFKISAAFLGLAFFAVACSEDSESLQIEPAADELSADLTQDIPGQYIVVYKQNNGRNYSDLNSAKKGVRAETNRILQENAIEGAEVVHLYGKMLNGATLKISAEQADVLRSDSRVAYVEQDRIHAFAPPCGTPNGGPCDGGGGGDDGSTTQETPWGITRVNGVSGYTGTNKAYVIDSGIDLDHPDLIVDGGSGFNAFTSGKDGQSLDDGNGHGTHVAGTIAAVNNALGVIGVAPGATVVPVKVLDSRGSGSYSGVIAGVDFVGANGSSGDVANMSLGGPTSQALDDAVLAASEKGIIFTLAAGNSSTNAGTSSPARVNGANIYTISSMAQGDVWSSFSNYGNPPVDFCAPGSSVKSTWKNGGYNTISGTSMAAPHAAGVLLLGSPRSGGTVNDDPDGNADPIIVH